MKVDAPGRLRVAGGEHLGRVRDICRDAALVELDRTWPVETAVSLEMTLPRTEGAIVVAGRVVREIHLDGGMRGVAILFSEPDPLTLLKVDLFLDSQTAEQP